MKVTIYHNPRCTKSRQALKVIEESSSHEPDIKLYLKDGLTREEVLDIQKKRGINQFYLNLRFLIFYLKIICML